MKPELVMIGPQGDDSEGREYVDVELVDVLVEDMLVIEEIGADEVVDNLDDVDGIIEDVGG